MKIGDIYINKHTKSIIQIDCFAFPMSDFLKSSIVVYNHIEKHDEIGICPSFNGYGSQEDIEKEYTLLIPQEKLNNYTDFNKIIDLANTI